MRCKQCEYRLWNLTSRTCPECGTPFLPGEFEFVPNSVRFCCPHCSQDYYGTAANGHLVPSTFDCVRCHRRIDMDEMVLLPAEGVEEEETLVEELPWLVRERRGFIKSWFSTIGMALIRPGRVMQLAPVESSTGSAWWFAIVTNVVVLFLSFIPLMIFPFVAIGRAGGFVAGFLPCCAGLGVSIVLGIAAWGLLTHGALLITGKVSHTIERTYQGICFSSGANIASAVPCLGYYLGWVWWLVSAVMMVKEGQQVSGLRAAVAVLTLPGLLLAGGAIWMNYTVNRSLTMVNAFSLQSETQRVTDAIMQHVELNAYTGPDHALRLAANGSLGASDFVTIGSVTMVSDIPVNDKTLEDFDAMSLSQQNDAVDKAAAALPDDVIAHRVGDFVFTCHGAKLNDCPPDLWIVICAADPGVYTLPSAPAAATNPTVMVAIGQVDGTVRQIFRTQLAAELADQNDVRAAAGLPPLPDPFTVTHAQPARKP